MIRPYVVIPDDVADVVTTRMGDLTWQQVLLAALEFGLAQLDEDAAVDAAAR